MQSLSTSQSPSHGPRSGTSGGLFGQTNNFVPSGLSSSLVASSILSLGGGEANRLSPSIAWVFRSKSDDDNDDDVAVAAVVSVVLLLSLC